MLIARTTMGGHRCHMQLRTLLCSSLRTEKMRLGRAAATALEHRLVPSTHVRNTRTTAGSSRLTTIISVKRPKLQVVDMGSCYRADTVEAQLVYLYIINVLLRYSN